MRRLLILLAACGSSTPHTGAIPAEAPAPISAPTPVVAPVAEPPSAPDPDPPTVIAKSKQFFDAVDKIDIEAALASIDPAFVMFEDGRYMDKDFFPKWLHRRADRHAPARTRTWNDEHVYPGENSIVFIGHAIEHVPATSDAPAIEGDGYNTLVWTRSGGSWKIALWEWARGGVSAERDRWNDTFKGAVGFNKNPNQLLVDTVKGRKPGTALDLAIGQGRNAIFLASQGWKVTGVDISDTGIKIARETAAAKKLQLETVQADLDKWDLGTNRWDLVTMIYAGDDTKLVERIKPSLKKGGLFVLEYFHHDSDASKYGAGGWETGKLAAIFKDGYKILRDDVVDDIADWSLSKQKLVRFVAQKL